MFFIFLILFSVGDSCHPQCRYLCDDPVFNATCSIVCVKPDCIYDQTCDYSPACTIQCPEDQCESDSCPACETICQPSTHIECGQPLCAPPNCTWSCVKPTNPPPIRCEVQCERPACEYSSGSIITLNMLIFSLLVFLL
jgi:hypothetical protein